MNYNYDSSLLKKVSRSFYLTIRILPRTVRYPISIAYMLGRTADTITDTNIVEDSNKLELITSLHKIISTKNPNSFNIFHQKIKDFENELSSEKILLNSIPQQIQFLSSLPSFEQTQIIWVIDNLIEGMKMDLSTFNSTNDEKIQSLNTSKQLEDYIFFVAGSVGEFWTRIINKNTNAINDYEIDKMVELGIDFGKSLQLTNIIRDTANDLRNGRCYIPSTTLKNYDLNTSDLLSNSKISQTENLLQHLIKYTLKYFISSEKYITMLPKNHLRLRLSILIPAAIGLQTLELLLKEKNWLDTKKTKKISRFKTYTIIIKCVFCVISDQAIYFWMRTKIKRIKMKC